MAEDIGIPAVSETLFLPLYALALGSRRPDPIIADDGAVELTRRLDQHFADSDVRLFRRLAAGRLPSALITTMSLRIRRYDRYAREFLEGRPDAVVVSLGCGLDDRRRRVDNGTVRWYDLDLPEVIDLRRRFLSENERMRFIASSVLDFAWMDQLPDVSGSDVLFIAEGLFMYLPPDAVRSLVVTLADRFPASELVAELANERIVRMMQREPARSKLRRQFSLSENVVYSFGPRDSQQIAAWDPRIELLDEWTYFDEEVPRLGWMNWFARFPLFKWSQWTAHYRLGASA